LKQPEGCELRVVQISDGVTAEVVDKLRNKKTGQRTEAERWQDIYKLLFPNEMMPSPCEFRSFVWLSFPSKKPQSPIQDFSFEDFSLKIFSLKSLHKCPESIG
jgi:hypothetical protein